MNYIRVCNKLWDPGTLVPVNEDIRKYLKPGSDSYRSIHYYNEEQFKKFQEAKSIEGMTDVHTSNLIFDFDSDDLDKSAQDTWEICDVLIGMGLPKDALAISFSGNKGFHVEVRTEDSFTPAELRNVVYSLAKGLETFDNRIWNASRLIRIENTKHQDSGLYKIPLSLNELQKLSIAEISDLAKDIRPLVESVKVKLPAKVLKLAKKETTLKIPEVVKELSEPVDLTLNLSEKPVWLTNCNYAMSKGYFGKGMRHDAVIRLTAIYKSQGLTKEAVFSQVNHIMELRKSRSGLDFKTGEIKSDVYRFHRDHKGGVFNCKTDPWMRQFCDSLGPSKCHRDEEEQSLIRVDNMLAEFEHFAKNSEEYIVRTGIESLDNKLKMMVGNVLGVLAPPSAGKTSLAIKMLNNMSKAGFESIFFSYDMYKNLLCQRLIQRHTKIEMEDLYDVFKENDEKKILEIKRVIKEEYGNVTFGYKANQTVDDMEKSIVHHQNTSGKKVKVVVVDYLELVNGESNDSTQASLNVASKLKNLSINQEVLVILILQPQKTASKPDQPIESFSNAKGSGMIGQSVSYFLGCHREGLSPDYPGEDNYFTVRCLKNRTGSLFTLDYAWSGITGDIRELTPVELQMLGDLKKRKSAATDDGKDGF